MKKAVTLYNMTLYEFNILDLNGKMEIISKQGVYLDNHIAKVERFNLYAIDMFFAEVCYNAIKNKITEIQSFKSGDLLDRYSNIDTLFF